jgi:capsular exopolysaccharide synthesis family protein
LAQDKKQGKEKSEVLAAIAEPKSAAAEAYRALRTNIQFASPDKPAHIIMATSTRPDDGKSTTIANLAVTFAEAGSPTVLVDADMRRPHLHQMFGLSNDAGLTSWVGEAARGNEAASVPIPLQKTQADNLMLLTSGPVPPNPSEILASQRMVELLSLLRKQADYVLIDTPPIIAVTDAAVLAPRVDGVFLVINAGKTRRDLAVKARDLLRQVNANLLGVVLNNATLDKSAYEYYG